MKLNSWPASVSLSNGMGRLTTACSSLIFFDASSPQKVSLNDLNADSEVRYQMDINKQPLQPIINSKGVLFLANTLENHLIKQIISKVTFAFFLSQSPAAWS